MKMILFFLVFLFSQTTFAKEKILVALNVKEPLGANSQILKEGIKLAYDQQPKELTDNYELVYVDNDGSLNDSTSKLAHEIKKGGVVAILGGMNSDQAHYINIIAKKYKIPFLTPYATNTNVTSDSSYTFRICFDDEYQVETLTRYIHDEHKLKRGMIIVNEKQTYPIGIKSLFQKKFKQFRGTSLEVIPYVKADNIDLKAIEKIKKFNPEFILLPAYEEAPAIIQNLLTHQIKTVFFGTDSWGGDSFLQDLKKIKEPFMGYYVQHWSPEFKAPANQKFIQLKDADSSLKKYTMTAALAPLAMGYESLNFIFKAIAEKRSETLTESLQYTSMDGITGFIKMNEHRTPKKSLFIYKVNNTGEKFEKAFN